MKLWRHRLEGEKTTIEECKEGHRYWLAVVLILGFLALIGVAMVGGYDAPTELASIFSGWIVAIIGFYFLDQAADRSQQQATIISDKAGEKAAKISRTGQEETEQIVKEAKAKIDKLENEKKILIDLAAGYRKKFLDKASERDGAPK